MPALVFLLSGCGTPPRGLSVETPKAFYPEKLAAMDEAVAAAIAEKKCPGGVLWVEHGDQVYHKAYGQRAVEPAPERITEDTIYDAASLTKVVACTPAMMLLIERGQVALDAPARTYLPEFQGERQRTDHCSATPGAHLRAARGH